MTLVSHFQLMAGYNTRMNTQIYNAASELSTEVLSKDMGAFFGSVLGTLNHILVGDLIWLSRFALHSERYTALQAVGDFPSPLSLSHLMYSDFDVLRQARVSLDETIERWCLEIKEADFCLDMVYKNTKGIESQRNFGELVAHLFNHQTHHRGQVSVLLSQEGHDIGVTDFLIDIPDSRGGSCSDDEGESEGVGFVVANVQKRRSR